MTLIDGTWRASVELEDASYQYKYFINGAWPTDMCHDETWGAPESEYWIDPGADGCIDDGHSGQNAVLLIGQEPGLDFVHTPELPAYVSAASGRLSLRFRARAGQVTSASVTANNTTYPMHLQFQVGGQETWRASVPEAAQVDALVGGPGEPARGDGSGLLRRFRHYRQSLPQDWPQMHPDRT